MLDVSIRDFYMRHHLEIKWGTLLTMAAIGVRILLSAGLYLNPDEAVHLSAACARVWNIHHHPPLLLWWLWLASYISQSELWLRLLPSIAGGLLPMTMTLWLRFYVSWPIAWAVGILTGFSPVIVLLTMQVRGYALALLFTLAALICLEMLLRRASVWVTVAHFVFLVLAALTEFVVLFPIAGIFVFTLLRLRISAEFRALWRWVVGGYAVLAGIYTWLFFYIVLPLARIPKPKDTYIDAALWHPRQDRFHFALEAICGQFGYVTGSGIHGGITAALFVLGCLVCIRRRDDRWILFATVPLCVLAACVGVYPMGYTRHAVIVGVIGLGGAVVGLNLLIQGSKTITFFLAASIIGSWILYPPADVSNIPLAQWQKRGWDQGVAEIHARVPRGAILFMNSSGFESIKASALSREELKTVGPWSYFKPRPTITTVNGLFFITTRTIDPSTKSARRIVEAVEEIKRVNPYLLDRIWILGGGWTRVSLAGKNVQVLIDRPELWLGSMPLADFMANYSNSTDRFHPARAPIPVKKVP